MKQAVDERQLSGTLRTGAAAMRRRALPTMKRNPIFALTLIACALAVIFWGFLASDRYVSEARVLIQRTDMAGGQSMDFGSLLAGATNNNRTDQLLLREYLLSHDMLEKLQEKLDLRSHYSDSSRDFLLRLSSSAAAKEDFYDHYLSRVEIEFDDYAGVLVIKAQAYDPETARAITTMLVEEGERAMNDVAHRLAEEQVGFLERQVTQMGERVQQARAAVIRFQNEKGLLAPQGTAENLAAVVNRLEAQRSELQARRAAMMGYLAPTAPAIVELDLQIAGIDKQIAREQGRLATPKGTALNATIEEFQRLQFTAEFAQDVYKTALVALEKGRVEATRTLKKVSVLQSPTLPEEPARPRRLYRIAVFILIALLLAGMAHLLAAIVRDHKD